MSKSLILAIDPGNVDSGYALVDADTLRPIQFGKVNNYDLLDIFTDIFHDYKDTEMHVAIEMIKNYGMSVGQTVFDTCVFIGRFWENLERFNSQVKRKIYIYRQEEKMCICHSMKANDTTIRQALIDRFAPDEPNHGKGTKKNRGFFYGFHRDCWSAYAIAITYHDLYINTIEETENA